MNDESDRSAGGRRRASDPHWGHGAGDRGPRASWSVHDAALYDAVDVADVRFDDEFLDLLSQSAPTPTRDAAEYELAALLSGWRAEALAEPGPALPGLDEVETAMGLRRKGRRSARVMASLRVVAGAAAIAIVAGAGLSVVAEGAQPGDSLWNVKKVVFAQAASETQAAFDVRSDLEQAEASLAAGDTAGARHLISRAQSRLGPVRDPETRERMSQWIERLRDDDPSTSATSTRQRQRAGEEEGSVADPGSATPTTSSTETSTSSDRDESSPETSTTRSTPRTTVMVRPPTVPSFTTTPMVPVRPPNVPPFLTTTTEPGR
ncbi:MAG: anti-sigma-D factor RsdA [Gordonia sp. (in: high G+C Gram-positive bacteria)]